MHTLSALELHKRFIEGDLTAEKITLYFLNRIQKYDQQVQSFLAVFGEKSLIKAKELDTKRKQGKALGKLAGIPIAIKDNIHIKGEHTTCASQILANYKATFNATTVSLLEEQDAILIGKTNMDEFAMGSSNENSSFFPTKNPWNLSCVPGGSSGGSAACIAARLALLSLGSDTGGSIRQPAAFTGVVGFKPTYGRVSRYGLVAYASSLDQIGPFGVNVEDTALLTEIISRHCPFDGTSLDIPPAYYMDKLDETPPSKTIGVPWHYLDALAEEAKKNFTDSIELLKNDGFEIVDINLDILKLSLAAYYTIATAEASSNVARFDGIRYGHRSKRATTIEEVYTFSRQEGFGPEVRNRILLGTYVLSAGHASAYYRKAQQVRTLIIQDFKKAFLKCDVIAMPVSPFTAFPLKSIHDPLQMYLQDIYTIGINLAGLPAISVPSGLSADGKPFGLQLMASPLGDLTVFQYAKAFERLSTLSQQIPPLFASA